MLDYKIITKTDMQSPGEVIQSYIIDGLGIGVRQLSRALNVPPNRMYQIIQNKREVSVDTAIRLGYFLDMSPSFWLDIQTQYQLQQHEGKKRQIKSDVLPFNRAAQRIK
jgi:addiction module HigA family antidote